jgi:hypothetical protein
MAVFVKVRLMDLVSVPDYACREYGAPGSDMHVDFVLAYAGTLEPRLVIELDDRSHERPGVKERDASKNTALAAGVPFLREAVTGRYSAATLRASIREAMGTVAR